jgi:hypothetical protein
VFVNVFCYFSNLANMHLVQIRGVAANDRLTFAAITSLCVRLFPQLKQSKFVGASPGGMPWDSIFFIAA